MFLGLRSVFSCKCAVFVVPLQWLSKRAINSLNPKVYEQNSVFQIITEGRHHPEWRPDMVDCIVNNPL